MGWLLFENDPGLPAGQLDDPLAGLGMSEAQRRVVELTLQHYPLEEAKAIGTAMQGGALQRRDSAMRRGHSQGKIRAQLSLASKNAVRELDTLFEDVQEKIGGLIEDWMARDLTFEQMRQQSADAWTEAYDRVRNIGRKAAGVDRLHPQSQVLQEEEVWFRSAVREELGYWNLFIEEQASARRRNALNERRMWQRFDNYKAALMFMYEATRAMALPDNTMFYWMGPKPEDPAQKGRICEGCQQMMAWSPFPKNRLPAVPRDGTTPCLTNCRHRLVVRVASEADIARRHQQLPTREAMVRAMRRIREHAHGTGRSRRARAHAGRIGNVFSGQRLPKNPRISRSVGRRRLSEDERIEHHLARLEEAEFDNPNFRHLDLYYVARLLADAARKRPVNTKRVRDLLDRFMAALEITVLALQGRPDAVNFSTVLRKAAADLWDALDRGQLAESDSALVLAAMAGVG